MKLFVYGIFLDENRRSAYGMSNPQYAVVPDYATYQLYDEIVEARPCKGAYLTGLIVEVAPTMVTPYGERDNWERLDDLERGYQRATITTVRGEEAYIYAGKELNNDKHE